MLLGIRWRSMRAKIIAWSFVPTTIILVAVALVTFTAYQQVTEDLVIERNQELTRLSAVELWRRVRALQPWPGCHTRWQGKLLKIMKAVPLPGEQRGGEPGKVVTIKQPQGIIVGVQTAEGVLQLLQVQLEGKRVMSAEEFVRGQRSFVETLLPS